MVINTVSWSWMFLPCYHVHCHWKVLLHSGAHVTSPSSVKTCFKLINVQDSRISFPRLLHRFVTMNRKLYLLISCAHIVLFIYLPYAPVSLPSLINRASLLVLSALITLQSCHIVLSFPPGMETPTLLMCFLGSKLSFNNPTSQIE